MKYNFDFLNKEKKYNSFTNACIEAEKSLTISYSTAAILSRRALELAVKWVFSYDDELQTPYQDNLASLICDYKFKSIIDIRLFPMITYIQKLGNKAVHTSTPVTRQQAVLSLKNLFEFISWIDYCYSDKYDSLKFDESILADKETQKKTRKELKELYDKLGAKDKKLEEIIKENEQLRKENAKKRIENEKKRVFDLSDVCEFDTRKMYVDLEIELCGWEFGKDCLEEVMVDGMPSASGKGYADYVLFDDDQKPLAVIETKNTSKDARIGKIQAKCYADCLEKQYNTRPIIFYTNGFDYYIWDDKSYPEREISGIYTKKELQHLNFKNNNRKSLKNPFINDEITDRYYQKMAVKEVCNSFEKGNRKALIVMATGAGKTRTVVSLVDVLISKSYVKNILFLADRTVLVKQAKQTFKQLLPELSLCNLLDSKDNPNSRMVFSTYPTMMNAIDDVKDEFGEKLFTKAHFDLIILDESHRSIYKKYQAIFNYFDSMLVGLTATPRSDIDKNTYSIFELEDNVPTYAYELDEAIRDKFLVPYHSIELESKFMKEGIHYDELLEDEKEVFQETFKDVKDIRSSEIHRYLFNCDTVDKVLKELMNKGLKIEGGDKLGKTIIFAKNTIHANFIIERFNKLYPEYKGDFSQAVYNEIKYAEKVIDDFSKKDSMPQIVVSVDMMDTGVDVPEILNLVFFKKVRSKTKFWQMVGRGTRLCKDLYEKGKDKDGFRIFDYCGNFEFFRINKNEKNSKIQKSLTENLFNIKVNLIFELQNSKYQTDKYIKYRKYMIDNLIREINEIDENKFDSRMKIKFIHKFKNEKSFNNLSENDVKELEDNIASLIRPMQVDEFARRFDYLMYSIQYCELKKIISDNKKSEVMSIAENLSKVGIPQLKDNQKTILQQLQTNEYWQNSTIFDYDIARNALREFIKFIEPVIKPINYTDFGDVITKVAEKDYDGYMTFNDLRSYKKKVESYLREHSDDIVVYKLRHNKPLDKEDIKYLEDILWNKLGSKDDYIKEYNEEPLLNLVSSIVGFDIETANKEFSQFLSDERLNMEQIRFVKLIIDYIVQNGSIDKKIISDLPFNRYENISVLFQGKTDVIPKIVSVIDKINNRLIV